MNQSAVSWGCLTSVLVQQWGQCDPLTLLLNVLRTDTVSRTNMSNGVRKGTRTEWNVRKGSVGTKEGEEGHLKISPEGSGMTEQEAGSSRSGLVGLRP